METVPIQGDVFGKIVAALKRSMLFSTLDEGLLAQMANSCRLLKFAPREIIVAQGKPSDAFFIILSGAAAVFVRQEESGENLKLAELGASDGIGEMGLITGEPRSATVVAFKPTLALKLEKRLFDAIMERTPEFGKAICKSLANRLIRADRHAAGNEFDLTSNPPSADVLELLPVDFIQRHRVVPVKKDGQSATIGFVDSPTPKLMSLIKRQLPSMEIATVSVRAEQFSALLEQYGGGITSSAGDSGPTISGGSVNLETLLRRMVAEGASDLHLTAKETPRWRIDGDMLTIKGAPILGADDVFEMLKPVMPEEALAEFEETNDADFAHAIEGLARFRVNIFRDAGGVGTVMRVIPMKILTMDQLGLPPVVSKFCESLKGMVLVTGPTGSGKSTTLAAMIHHINQTHKGHIITLEDPIEFVHKSAACLVNQRELGRDTASFNRALRAALREDPDIVLVGEMRDLETVSLALEIANTGHLVFGTLHTTTAIGTVERIIEMFPAEEQNRVRSSLAESLVGVVAQNLCRKMGGGRIAAYEIMVNNSAISNLIREAKNHQILSIMQTGKALGNTLLNEELMRHVMEKKVDPKEALSRSADKKELVRMFEKKQISF